MKSAAEKEAAKLLREAAGSMHDSDESEGEVLTDSEFDDVTDDEDEEDSDNSETANDADPAKPKKKERSKSMSRSTVQVIETIDESCFYSETRRYDGRAETGWWIIAKSAR